MHATKSNVTLPSQKATLFVRDRTASTKAKARLSFRDLQASAGKLVTLTLCLTLPVVLTGDDGCMQAGSGQSTQAARRSRKCSGLQMVAFACQHVQAYALPAAVFCGWRCPAQAAVRRHRSRSIEIDIGYDGYRSVEFNTPRISVTVNTTSSSTCWRRQREKNVHTTASYNSINTPTDLRQRWSSAKPDRSTDRSKDGVQARQ